MGKERQSVPLDCHREFYCELDVAADGESDDVDEFSSLISKFNDGSENHKKGNKDHLKNRTDRGSVV